MIPSNIALMIPRLATEHVGELVATRDALVRSLSAVGLDLHDLASHVARPMAAVPIHRAASFGDLARAVRDLDRGRLSARERAFVAEMCAKGFGFRPSPRQASWLEDILNRLQVRAA